MGCGVYADAQTHDVKWSELNRRRGQLIDLLPKDSNDFYALRWSGAELFGSYQVTHHQNLKDVAHARIRLVVNQSMANFESAMVVGDQFVVFLSDRMDKKHSLYMQVFSDELVPTGDPVLLASFDLDRSHGKGWFNIVQSANEAYFAVVWEIPGRKDERDLYGFIIFDKLMNIVNDGEYPLPFDPELSVIHSHHISNTGDYFLAMTEYDEADKKAFSRVKVNFKALHIYHIAKDGLVDYTLDVAGKRVEAMAMTSDNNNIFTITGIYGNRDENGVLGVFYQRIDLVSGKKLDEGFKEFPKEFITEDWTERQVKKQKKREERGVDEGPQLYNYNMREATIMEDGSIVGTMEQIYIQVRSFADTRSGQSSSTYYYYYNDIIAYRIDPEGEFAWIDKVPKLQVSTNDGGPFSSYESFIADGKVAFIFNDDIRNYDESGKFIDSTSLWTASYGRNKNAVALAEIDLLTGEQNRRTFFDRSEINALAVPKLFDVNYSTGEMILYSIWGSKEKFGILRFK
ncbi:MAG: hypothetical protein A3D92_09490 [Bacteroidetes bacterium RIFCSPHIGHO2_02_FULL_44_7]|nr:MAG: hypothetical protein A3D92_09490 [Bacteroidetes bacterium RIFCSPHIGHO2_02_FULL_44_7]